MAGVTRRLAEFAADIDSASLDPRVVERTRMLLMDQAGISIRGRNDAGSSASMAPVLQHRMMHPIESATARGVAGGDD